MLKKRPTNASLLPSDDMKHLILEPEYHQDKYIEACERAKNSPGSFRLSVESSLLVRSPQRGIQPIYSDFGEDDPSLSWQGQEGRNNHNCEEVNVCALKSNCVRDGYIDFSLARSVSREFYESKKGKAGVKKGDVLINSTGDGTIGRAAVYDESFPAVVDGHITIVRLKEIHLNKCWGVAAYICSEEGQLQIYRYINGSSGQVEIYPADVSRIWVRRYSEEKYKHIEEEYSEAYKEYRSFVSKMHRLKRIEH